MRQERGKLDYSLETVLQFISVVYLKDMIVTYIIIFEKASVKAEHFLCQERGKMDCSLETLLQFKFVVSLEDITSRPFLYLENFPSRLITVASGKGEN